MTTFACIKGTYCLLQVLHMVNQMKIFELPIHNLLNVKTLRLGIKQKRNVIPLSDKDGEL